MSVREYSSQDYEGVRNLYFGTYKELAVNNTSIRSYIHKSFKNTFDKVSHCIIRLFFSFSDKET